MHIITGKTSEVRQKMGVFSYSFRELMLTASPILLKKMSSNDGSDVGREWLESGNIKQACLWLIIRMPTCQISG